MNDEKRITLLSTTQLRNQTSHPLAVRIGHPLQSDDSIHSLSPGEALPLPPQHSSSAYIASVRPMRTGGGGEEYGWSEPCSLPTDASTSQPAASAAFMCPPLPHQPSLRPWHLVVHRAGRVGGVCEVCICPSLVVTNLLPSLISIELRAPNSSVGADLRVGSGDSAFLHTFVNRASVRLRIGLGGYSPSRQVMIEFPSPSDEQTSLTRSISANDRQEVGGMGD